MPGLAADAAIDPPQSRRDFVAAQPPLALNLFGGCHQRHRVRNQPLRWPDPTARLPASSVLAEEVGVGGTRAGL